MLETNQYMRFFMNFSVVYSNLSKKIDSALSIHGVSFSEFMILFHLNGAPMKRLKRIELAEKLSLSASGITRLIAPMEKIGLVHKESNKRDARVSLVKISASGVRVLEEATVTLDMVSRSILSVINEKAIEGTLKTFKSLGGSISLN